MSDERNATPAEMLERRIMDPCVAKSEAEWWAKKEIEKQRAEVERQRAELDKAQRHIEMLQAKLDAEKSCACAYDDPNEVCLPHSPILEKARAENEQLRDQIYESIPKWQANELQREINQLRDAMQFYADPNRYKSTSVHMCGHSTGASVLIDGGRKAREALGVKL